MGDKVLMLDALLATIKECDEVYVDAKFLTITEEVDVFRNDVEKRLYDEFGLTAEDISVINDMKPVYYTIAVKNVVNGVDYSTVDNNADNGQEEETLIEEQENEEILEDLLPEESAILNGEESE